MLTIEQRKQRASDAIGRAMATLDAVRGDLGEALAKATTARTGTLSDATVAEAHAAVARILGTDDPAAVAEAITAAMAAPVDLGADPETGVLGLLAKAATAAPSMPATARLGLGLAELEMERRLAPLEMLAKHAGTVPPEKLREARSSVEAVAFAKTIQPTRLDPRTPSSASVDDRRPALRELAERQRAAGNEPGAVLTERELMLEEFKAVRPMTAA